MRVICLKKFPAFLQIAFSGLLIRTHTAQKADRNLCRCRPGRLFATLLHRSDCTGCHFVVFPPFSHLFAKPVKNEVANSGAHTTRIGERCVAHMVYGLLIRRSRVRAPAPSLIATCCVLSDKPVVRDSKTRRKTKNCVSGHPPNPHRLASIHSVLRLCSTVGECCGQRDGCVFGLLLSSARSRAIASQMYVCSRAD